MNPLCTQSGRTPLIWAALEGHTAIVELLAHSGAMLNAQDEVRD